GQPPHPLPRGEGEGRSGGCGRCTPWHPSRTRRARTHLSGMGPCRGVSTTPSLTWSSQAPEFVTRAGTRGRAKGNQPCASETRPAPTLAQVGERLTTRARPRLGPNPPQREAVMLTALTIATKAVTWTTVTLAAVAWASTVDPVIEFNVDPSTGANTTINPDQLAHSYANEHGLTDCTEPANAELDDVFLTLASDLDGNPTTDQIRPVDLDAALDSAGKRLVLLACDKEQS